MCFAGPRIVFGFDNAVPAPPFQRDVAVEGSGDFDQASGFFEDLDEFQELFKTSPPLCWSFASVSFCLLLDWFPASFQTRPVILACVVQWADTFCKAAGCFKGLPVRTWQNRALLSYSLPTFSSGFRALIRTLLLNPWGIPFGGIQSVFRSQAGTCSFRSGALYCPDYLWPSGQVPWRH